MKAHITEDAMHFGCFAVLTATGRKFVQVNYCGSTVSPMLRGKSSLAAQTVSNFFEGKLGEVQLTDMADLTEEGMRAKLRNPGLSFEV